MKKRMLLIALSLSILTPSTVYAHPAQPVHSAPQQYAYCDIVSTENTSLVRASEMLVEMPDGSIHAWENVPVTTTVGCEVFDTHNSSDYEDWTPLTCLDVPAYHVVLTDDIQWQIISDETGDVLWTEQD